MRCIDPDAFIASCTGVYLCPVKDAIVGDYVPAESDSGFSTSVPVTSEPHVPLDERPCPTLHPRLFSPRIGCSG